MTDIKYEQNTEPYRLYIAVGPGERTELSEGGGVSYGRL